MVFQTQPITAAEFDRQVALPENLHRNLELIAGEIVEKVVSNPRSSAIAAWILGKMAVFADECDLGYVTGADGGYVVSGERYIPDAAFVAKARQPVLPTDAYNPLAPDLALEMLSPTNTDEEMRVKIVNYLAAGTGQPVQILGPNDMLDGGEILPGFTLPVGKILAK